MMHTPAALVHQYHFHNYSSIISLTALSTLRVRREVRQVLRHAGRRIEQ